MARRDVDLDRYPQPHGLTEAELLRAYGVEPGLRPTPETVRRRLIDALEAETAPRADSHDTSSPADVVDQPAVRP